MLPNGDDALTAAPGDCPNENAPACPKADGAAPVAIPNGVVAVDVALPPNNGGAADATGFQNGVAAAEVAVVVVAVVAAAVVCPNRGGAGAADEGAWPNGDGTEEAGVAEVVVCPNGVACPKAVVGLLTAVEPNSDDGNVVVDC